MRLLLPDVLLEEEKEGEQPLLARVAASLVFPRGFSGFALFAMGRGPAADADGGQVAVRVGLRGSAHAGAHSQTQTQRPRAGLRQRRVAGVFHESEQSARAAPTALRLLCGRFGLLAGAPFRPLLPVQGRTDWDIQRRGKGPRDQT